MSWIARIFDRRQATRARDEPAAIHDGEADAASTDFELLLERAERCLVSAQFEEAKTLLNDALLLKHDSAWAHFKMGVVLMRLGAVEDAVDSFVMSLCFSPDMAQAHYALALAEQKLGRNAQALASIEQVLRCEPSAAAHNQKGVLLLEEGDVAGALTSFEAAIALDANDGTAHNNLGYVLFRDRGDYLRGASHIERALELDPENIDAQCNYSMVLVHQGKLEQALALCNRILAAQPGTHEARLNRALILLQLGRFDAGWDDYEARKAVRCNFAARELPCQEWHGEDISGKTILVYGEQGVGDEIMFASCLDDVIRRCGHCVIECAPTLERLFRRSFEGATVFAGKQTAVRPSWWESAPPIDLKIPAGSLPRFFRRNRADFPAHGGYLIPDPVRAEYWRKRLADLGRGTKVGISWRGGTPSTRRSLRSIDLSDWSPILATRDAHFVSLQYGDTAEELAMLQPRGLRVTHWPEAIDDLGETAALISALDVVISVCTAVIHLAGAIGRKVWVLVPTSPEWRYQAAGETMPWYPSATLIRQECTDDWRPTIAGAACRLRQLANEIHNGSH